MSNSLSEKEENKKKLRLAYLAGALSAVSFITLILTVCIYTETMSAAAKIILITIACIIFAAGISAAMYAERTIGYYMCKHCEKTFVPGLAAYVFGMHAFTKRYLKCPKCGKKSFCKKVLSKKE